MTNIQIGLPDGKTLEVPAGSTVLAVAERIGKGLAKAALAGRSDGELVDLRLPLHNDVSIEIVTARDPQAGEVIRHSAEHVMADAVKRLFPGVQIDVGRTDHSEKFQYDFLVDRPFTPEDLEKIHAEMSKIVKEKSAFTRRVMTREAAREFFGNLGEELKVSRLDDIPDGEEISIFSHGQFDDLCRGPHVQRTDQIGAFKLTESAGAYWRGDESNPMLQRIYGTAFSSKQELEAHLAQLEEARQRDHRRVGVDLELFHIDPISPGSPFYLPKGMVVYNGLIDFIRSLYPKYGYAEVMTPQILRTDLFKTSGHYELFKDDMFILEGDDGEELAVKPMNCPGHCHLFSLRKHSYRELPIRYAEFSRLHRNERSGTLTGLSRVRSMAQDDAHIFCQPDQVEAELDSFFEMTREVWEALGIDCTEMSVATRPDGFVGEVEDWDRATEQLLGAIERAGYPRQTKLGEGAFYGPKLDFSLTDAIGREWQCGTFQADFVLPERLGAEYIASDGSKRHPVMLHRAILGSFERFLGILIENCAGRFPLWLAPRQVVVATIVSDADDYADELVARLTAAGLRVEADKRNEKINYKVREHSTAHVPAILAVGRQEVEAGTVSVRRLGQQGQKVVSLDEAVAAQ